jgi:ABC-type Fe3+ transport system permease subunit
MNRVTKPAWLDGQSRMALVLWCVLAFLVWNVVFDRMLVVAGRRFVHDASLAARQGATLLIDDRMPRAVLDGVRTASLSAAAVLVLACVVIPVARRRANRHAGL